MPLLAAVVGLVGAARLITAIFDMDVVAAFEGAVLLAVSMALVLRRSR